MDGHRLLSSILVVASGLALAIGADLEAFITLGSGIFVSTMLVWYPEEFGSLVGFGGGIVTQTSPGPFVRFFGWLFLLAGVAAALGTAILGTGGRVA